MQIKKLFLISLLGTGAALMAVDYPVDETFNSLDDLKQEQHFNKLGKKQNNQPFIFALEGDRGFPFTSWPKPITVFEALQGVQEKKECARWTWIVGGIPLRYEGYIYRKQKSVFDPTLSSSIYKQDSSCFTRAGYGAIATTCAALAGAAYWMGLFNKK